MGVPPAEEISFSNNKGQVLPGRIYLPPTPSTSALIFSHGFYSSKDATKIVSMAPSFAAAGFNVLAFDFSFICTPGIFPDFSILQEVEDLRAAAGFMRDRGIEELHLMGSSMGGVVALLCASETGAGIRSLVCIATPVRLGELLQKDTGLAIRDLPAEGMTAIDGVPIKNSFFREAAGIDVQAKAGRINAPTLVIHGTDDAVVDFGDAALLMRALAGEKKLIEIKGGDHNLTRADHLERLRAESLEWLRLHSGR
ncbi:MAG: alpha/beta fold hydrolase [Spirochaetes bacterium]|nr:MAG: alpha/beta fold hydrolase [Spirochaetota bacterium]